MTENGVIGYIQ